MPRARNLSAPRDGFGSDSDQDRDTELCLRRVAEEGQQLLHESQELQRELQEAEARLAHLRMYADDSDLGDTPRSQSPSRMRSIQLRHDKVMSEVTDAMAAVDRLQETVDTQYAMLEDLVPEVEEVRRQQGESDELAREVQELRLRLTRAEAEYEKVIFPAARPDAEFESVKEALAARASKTRERTSSSSSRGLRASTLLTSVDEEGPEVAELKIIKEDISGMRTELDAQEQAAADLEMKDSDFDDKAAAIANELVEKQMMLAAALHRCEQHEATSEDKIRSSEELVQQAEQRIEALREKRDQEVAESKEVARSICRGKQTGRFFPSRRSIAQRKSTVKMCTLSDELANQNDLFDDDQDIASGDLVTFKIRHQIRADVLAASAKCDELQEELDSLEEEMRVRREELAEAKLQLSQSRPRWVLWRFGAS
mmetsp:Transcript_21190/g.56524  ORF Transcript_21190/g.56524 Transcript_21190/m.56524 type:complete len:428 (-) Transcript_21190:155-1438(-)